MDVSVFDCSQMFDPPAFDHWLLQMAYTFHLRTCHPTSPFPLLILVSIKHRFVNILLSVHTQNTHTVIVNIPNAAIFPLWLGRCLITQSLPTWHPFPSMR